MSGISIASAIKSAFILVPLEHPMRKKKRGNAILPICSEFQNFGV